MYGLAVMLFISRWATIKNIEKIAFKQVYISGLYVLWRSFSCIGVKYNIGVIVALTQTDFVVVRSTDCGRIMSGFQIFFGQNHNQNPNTVKSQVEARVTIQEIKSLGVLQTKTCH